MKCFDTKLGVTAERDLFDSLLCNICITGSVHRILSTVSSLGTLDICLCIRRSGRSFCIQGKAMLEIFEYLITSKVGRIARAPVWGANLILLRVEALRIYVVSRVAQVSTNYCLFNF